MDWSIFKERNREIRALRTEKFKETILPIFQELFDMKERDNGSFTCYTLKYGIIDYYPKADKILIRERNKWIPRGRNWMMNNIVQECPDTGKVIAQHYE